MNQDRVLLLIAGAVLTHSNDVRNQRESYAITKVAEHVVDVSNEDKELAVQKLMMLRMVPKKRLDEGQSAITRMLAVAGFETKAVAE